MSKVLFQKTIYEFSIGIASPFCGMALIAFWKRGLYTYESIYSIFLNHLTFRNYKFST